MQYVFTADTDVGIVKNVNQDSVLVKHGKYEDKEVLMAIVYNAVFLDVGMFSLFLIRGIVIIIYKRVS